MLRKNSSTGTGCWLVGRFISILDRTFPSRPFLDLATHIQFTRYEKKKGLAKVTPLFIGVLSRIVRRWNQTGQKFAAEPDISKSFLTKHTTVLWLLILLTYTDIYQRLRQSDDAKSGLSRFSRALFLPLTSFAFVFKVSFTAADSPELLEGIRMLGVLAESISSLSLILQARLIFAGIGISFLFLIYHKIQRTPGYYRKGKTSHRIDVQNSS